MVSLSCCRIRMALGLTVLARPCSESGVFTPRAQVQPFLSHVLVAAVSLARFDAQPAAEKRPVSGAAGGALPVGVDSIIGRGHASGAGAGHGKASAGGIKRNVA